MTQHQYDQLVIDSKDEHSCLFFTDEAIPASHVGLFVPSRAFTIAQLKVYLVGFGLSEVDIELVAIHQRPKNAPFGGYVVTFPLPDQAQPVKQESV